jgi:hypothetical protein
MKRPRACRFECLESRHLLVAAPFLLEHVIPTANRLVPASESLDAVDIDADGDLDVVAG